MTEFEPPLPGSWDRTPSGFALANHEAAHVVVAEHHGIRVVEARVDRPIDTHAGTGGWTRFAKADSLTPELLKEALYVAIAPAAAEGRTIDRSTAARDGADEATAERLAYLLGWGDVEWNRAHDHVRTLLSLPSLRRRLAQVSGLLLERGAISGADLTASLTDGRGAELPSKRPGVTAG